MTPFNHRSPSTLRNYNGFYVVSSDSFIDSRGIPCTRNDNDFLPSYVRSRRLSVRLLFRFSDWRFSSITPRDRANAIGCVQKTQFSSMTLFIYFFKRIREQIVHGAILTYLQKKDKSSMKRRIYNLLFNLETAIWVNLNRIFKSNAISEWKE